MNNFRKHPFGFALLFLGMLLGMSACKYKLSYDEEGMAKLRKELTDKFGADTWYSEVTVLNPTEDETLIRVKETGDVNSLKGKAWAKQGGSWIPLDDMLFQFNDNKPQRHLFQLDDPVSLDTLVRLINRSQDTLSARGIDHVRIHFVSIQSAQIVRQEDRRVLYNISFQDKKGGSGYSFVYDLKGRPVAFNR